MVKFYLFQVSLRKGKSPTNRAGELLRTYFFYFYFCKKQFFFFFFLCLLTSLKIVLRLHTPTTATGRPLVTGARTERKRKFSRGVRDKET